LRERYIKVEEKDSLDGCAAWIIIPLLPFVLLGYFLEMLSNWDIYKIRVKYTVRDGKIIHPFDLFCQCNFFVQWFWRGF